jgi:hypothetical protein
MREPGGIEFALSGPELARLSPTMSSRKLQALAFIRHFYARWGASPTQGEIAAALHISKKRANNLVHQLSTEKMIEIVAGKTRGIRLVETAEELSEPEILVRLSAMGWTIADGGQIIQPPLTDKGLPLLPVLDFNPSETDSAGTGGEEQ